MARIDSVLTAKGIARSRERAKEMIKNGSIKVNGITVKKPSQEVSENDLIESSEKEKYVGRGALKLEKAYTEFSLDFSGRTCIDIGASTGGFTQFMVEHGAERVFAVDVGHGQLAESLRNDSRVVNMESTDIRAVSAEMTGGQADFICADVSFISLEHILPKIYELLKDGEVSAVLIKPQFEAGKKYIGKNGVVKDKNAHIAVLEKIDSIATAIGFTAEKYTCSAIKGGSGNTEYLVKLVKKRSEPIIHDFRRLVSESL